MSEEPDRAPRGCIIIVHLTLACWIVIGLIWAVATGKFDRKPHEPACVGTLDPIINRQCERPMNP